MKKYSHIIIFLLITLAIGASIFGIYFIITRIQSTLDETKKKELQFQIQEEKIKNLPNLGTTHEKILQEEPLLNLVYSSDQVVDVIRDIESLAKSENITLVITQKAEEKQKPISTNKSSSDDKEKKEQKEEKKVETITEKLPFENSVRLELRAAGDYKNIRNFIYKIETAPYALDVLAIDGSIAPEEEAESTPTTVSESADNPFLLTGEPALEKKVIASEKVVFLINIALYTR